MTDGIFNPDHSNQQKEREKEREETQEKEIKPGYTGTLKAMVVDVTDENLVTVELEGAHISYKGFVTRLAVPRKNVI